jgi:hypothetical protein
MRTCTLGRWRLRGDHDAQTIATGQSGQNTSEHQPSSAILRAAGW